MSVTPLKAGANILAAGPTKLIERCGEVVAGADKILQAAKAGVRIKIQEEGGIDQAQHAAHGLAWLATAVEGLRQMHDWAVRLEGEGRFGEFEQLLLIAAFGEYAAQIANGIP
ncbi:MAG: acyl-CoA dehydrogenase, partial [Hyphomicrobium sp.]